MNIFFTVERDKKEIELSISARYLPATRDVYYLANGDPGYPGDPEEIEIFDCVDLKTRLPVELTDAELAQVEELIREKAADDAFNPREE